MAVGRKCDSGTLSIKFLTLCLMPYVALGLEQKKKIRKIRVPHRESFTHFIFVAVSQTSLRYPKRINRMKQIDMRSMADKLINRETIVYVIAGGMTTAVNMATYYVLCYWAMMNHLIANIIAWVIAVTFAYFVNAGWVFRDKRTAVKEELSKMMKFFLARLFSLGVEEGGLFLFVSLLMWNNMAVKAGLAVLVIIINYVFSKFYIFNSAKKTTGR